MVGEARLHFSAAALLASLGAVMCLAGGAGAAFQRARVTRAQIAVFPVPGDRVASPSTQITFRGAPISELGPITVRGSLSGKHLGRLEADSDGRGGSFLPYRNFTPGEVVTVASALNIPYARGGRFSFTVASPVQSALGSPPAFTKRVRGDVATFRTRTDLHPVNVRILTRSPSAAPGDIFLAPQLGPVQDGPMIVDQSGKLVWFKPVPKGEWANDFRVQTYQGRPVLTWWQGRVSSLGLGFGSDVIADSHYHTIAVVHAGNGLASDLHEFQLTPQGTALITAYDPVSYDARSVGGSSGQFVFDSVVQEIDIKTGLVLFEWHALDHVSLTESHLPITPDCASCPYDYFHANSIQQDADGNLIISGRNTWAAYKVSDTTTRDIWRLGGTRSNFRMLAGTHFAFQHDVRVRASGDSLISMFDDGAGPPAVHKESRGLMIGLDFRHRTARRVAQYTHRPSLLAFFEGNYQQLPGGNPFIGWGPGSYFTEYSPGGRPLLDGRFADANSNYRAYSFPWSGAPTTRPAIAASSTSSQTTVYASWNGATNVASWRVLGGSSPGALQAVLTAPEHGFESSLVAPHESYVAVQALDSNGDVLSQSRTIHVG